MKTRLKKIKIYSADKSKVWKSGVYIGVSLTNSKFSNCLDIIEINSLVKEKCNNRKYLVGDYLHRLNIQINGVKNIYETENIANIMGKEIVKKISNCADVELDDFISAKFFYNETFNKKVLFFESVIKSNQLFEDFLNLSIRAYLDRLQSPVISYENAFKLSERYLIEELVIFNELVKKGMCTQVYPGSHLPIIRHIVKYQLNEFDNIKKMNLIELKYF